MKKAKNIIGFGIACIFACFSCEKSAEDKVKMDIHDYLHKELGVKMVQGEIEDPYIVNNNEVIEIGAKVYLLKGTTGVNMVVVEDVMLNKFYIDQSIGGHEFFKPFYYIEDSIDDKATTLLIENTYQMPAHAFESFFNHRYQNSIFSYDTGRLLFSAYLLAQNGQTKYDSVKMVDIRNRILERKISSLKDGNKKDEYMKYMHRKFLEIDLISETCHYLYCFDLDYSLYVVAVFPIAYTSRLKKHDKTRYRYVVKMIRI